MIIIPDLETIVLLVPRTGSSALRNAILARYPNATMLYRHMEADGVPLGYDRFRRVGVLRDPVDRLWSLYRYLRVIGEGRKASGTGKWEPSYVARQRASVDMPFNDWIVDNQTVFTSPYDQVDGAKFYPGFCVRHPIPENRKSQFIYLRPDLGTVVWHYRQLADLFDEFDLAPQSINGAPPLAMPALNDRAADHIARFFDWDTRASQQVIAA